jgi:hypothetical protein
MQNRHVLEGWLFANFIAMIAYYKLFERLRKAELLKKGVNDAFTLRLIRKRETNRLTFYSRISERYYRALLKPSASLR